MATRKKKKPQPASEPPKIHEATRAPGPSGVVFKGLEIDQAQAIAERQAERDVVTLPPGGHCFYETGNPQRKARKTP